MNRKNVKEPKVFLTGVIFFWLRHDLGLNIKPFSILDISH